MRKDKVSQTCVGVVKAKSEEEAQVYDLKRVSMVEFIDFSIISSVYIQLYKGGPRTAAASKMKCLMIIVNRFQPLTIITKHSILDVEAVLDPPLIKLFFYGLILSWFDSTNLDKALLLSRNQVFCLKNWQLWRAPTTIEFNVFCWNFVHVS